MSSPITTRLATPSDRDEVAALCLEAFVDEAVITWVLPDPTTRPAQMRAMFDASLDDAIDADSVLLAVTDVGAPVALSFWISRASAPEPTGSRPHPEEHPDDDPVARRLAAIEEATEGARPDVAHLYLSSMAVLPGHRGRGAGGAMITAGVARATALELPVHLEASTPESRRLYARHGFRDHGAPISLPGRGPVLQPMRRERTAP